MHQSSLSALFCKLLIAAWCCMSSLGSSNITSLPVSSVKIGALLPFNTTIGAFARRAIQLAVQDVNNAEDVLHGTQLVLEMFNSGCSPVQGAASAVELVKKGVVAVVGPQSSAVSQFAAHIGRETKVPFVSFGATDPNLSEMQYPYFIRVAPSDRFQMEAVAAFITNYGWREVVIFHMDDDYGTNGASALSDSLQMRGSKIVDKVALVPWIDKPGIDKKLAQLASMQTRIFVLHTYQDVGFHILHEASLLNMLNAEYVWIVTDLITTSLGDLHLDPRIMRYTQGIIGTRRYIAHSPQLESFLVEWEKNSPSHSLDLDPSQINAYGLYAYDSVWVVAHAISSYLHDKKKINFHMANKLPIESGGESELDQMQSFDGGADMKNYILGIKFMGTSGPIKFDKTGDLIGAAFEYINMVGRSPHPHVVGYWWANHTGVSLNPPPDHQLSNPTNAPDDEDFLSHGSAPANATIMPIIWPGGRTDAPRGWVLPKNGSPLKIGVPRKAGYTELVSVTTDANNVTSYSGFCIQVFEAALKYLPYAVPYNYEMFGNGVSTPEYSDLIWKLAHQDYDAVVGDVAILADRLRIVDFTQPYIDSGVVVLVPIKDKRKNNPWAFLRPFTSSMWTTVLLSFLFTGLVIWMLEHNVNEEFRGPPKKQLITVLTFIFSTLFFSHKEDTRSFLGRIVLIVWLFVILIINSSYTANLTSILTVEQLTPSIQGLESLIQSKLPIGYHTGSFVRDYLLSLNVNPGRLKDLESREMFQKALDAGPDRGGVAGIVDELPYVQLVQASNCKKYAIAGQEFTKTGWGFAFPRASEITADLSQAILKMSQKGELQRIQDYWFKDLTCEEAASNAQVQSNQLDLKSFWGLFLISAAASVVCVAIHLVILLRKYRQQQRLQRDTIVASANCLERLKQFIVFADKSISEKKRHQHGDASREQPCPHCGSSTATTSSSFLPRLKCSIATS